MSVVRFRKKNETKAVYVRSQSVSYSGADCVFMKITLPRAPWEKKAADAKLDGAFRQAASARDRNEARRRMKG